MKFSEHLLRRVAADPRFADLLVKNLGVPDNCNAGAGRRAYEESVPPKSLLQAEAIDVEFEDIE